MHHEVCRESSRARRLRVESLEHRRLLAVLTVQNDLDGTLPDLNGDGELSLREAIEIANNPGTMIDGFMSNDVEDTIEFARPFFDEPRTIDLVSQLPTITDDLSIIGRGAERLILSAGNGPDGEFGTYDGYRVLDINNGNPTDHIEVFVEGLTVRGGDAHPYDKHGEGGGVLSRENVTLRSTTITGNAGNSGGGIHHWYGTLIVENSTISGNATRGVGGGIQNGKGAGPSQLLVSDSIISGNFSTGGRGGGGAGGGGIWSLGQLRIDGSLIVNNHSRDSGGGIFISYLPGTQVENVIVNSTITGNDSNGRGGGGIKSEGDLLLIVGTTITNNSARFGGAMLSRGQAPTIQNSILSGNFGTVASDNLDGDFANPESNYNLLGSGDAIGGSNDITAIDDPLLGPLADNGGPTLTHALLPGSPAIDAGDPTIQFDPNEFDQRGAPFLRVADGDFPNDIAIDIGAYEAQSIPLADFDTDFDVDGADFLAWQRGFGNANAVRADGNSDDDSDVDASDLAAWSVSYGEPSVASSQSSALSANVAAAWQRLSFDPGDQSDFVEDGQAFVAAEALVNADGVRPLADSKPRSLDSTRVTARDLAMESLLPFEDESLGDAFR